MYVVESKDSNGDQPVSFHRDKLAALSAVSKADPLRKQTNDAQDVGFLLLQSAGVGIYGLDLNGLVTFVNPAARRMTGWTQEDLRGRTQHSMVHHSYADGRNYPREECPIYMAFHDGRTHCREDEVFWRKDGSWFPVEYTSTPIFLNGVLTGAVVIFSDISDRVRQRNWDQARIDILKGILRGGHLEDTCRALCNAFTAFQPGCQMTILSASPGTDQGNLEAISEPATPAVTHTVSDAAGTPCAIIHMDCGPHALASDARTSALAEIVLLLETAFPHIPVISPSGV